MFKKKKNRHKCTDRCTRATKSALLKGFLHGSGVDAHCCYSHGSHYCLTSQATLRETWTFKNRQSRRHVCVQRRKGEAINSFIDNLLKLVQRLLKARCFADTLATWGFYRSDKHPELRCLIFWRSHRCFPSRTATTSEAASRSSWSNGKPSSPSRLMFASIPLLQKRRISPPLTVFLSSSRLVWNLLAFVFFFLRHRVTTASYCTRLISILFRSASPRDQFKPQFDSRMWIFPAVFRGDQNSRFWAKQSSNIKKRPVLTYLWFRVPASFCKSMKPEPWSHGIVLHNVVFEMYKCWTSRMSELQHIQCSTSASTSANLPLNVKSTGWKAHSMWIQWKISHYTWYAR